MRILQFIRSNLLDGTVVIGLSSLVLMGSIFYKEQYDGLHATIKDLGRQNQNLED